MVTATIAIHLDEEFGVTAPSNAHPDATFRYLAGIAEADRGVGLVAVDTDDVDGVLGSVRSLEEVRNLSVLARTDDRVVFQYDTDVAALYRVVRGADVVPAFPYDVRDGVLYFETTTSADRLSDLGERLRAAGIRFEVRTLTQTDDPASVLTDRQRAAVRTAVREGYYDDPRRCTLTDLAASMGVAPSTASAVLHRAEGRVMRSLVAPRETESETRGEAGE